MPRLATPLLVAALLAAGCTLPQRPAPDEAPVEPGDAIPSRPADDGATTVHDPERERKLALLPHLTREATTSETMPRRHARPDVPENASETVATPPQDVQAAADRFVAGRLGEAFFREHVRANASATRHLALDAFAGYRGTEAADRWGWTDAWLVAYAFAPPGLEAETVDLELPVLPNGTVVTEDVWSLPDCVGKPGECEFRVGRDRALELAREAGLGEGVAPWEAEFHWHRVYLWPEGAPIPARAEIHGTFAWSVRNFTTPGSGTSLTIDANDGALLLADNHWARMDPLREE